MSGKKVVLAREGRGGECSNATATKIEFRVSAALLALGRKKVSLEYTTEREKGRVS